MPLVDVTFDGNLPESALRALSDLLPDIVAEGVACPEEPWEGPPKAGDIEIRFHEKSRLNVGDLNCVIEVRSKLVPSRVLDKQLRADRMHEAIVEAIPSIGALGLWLVLVEGAWAQ